MTNNDFGSAQGPTPIIFVQWALALLQNSAVPDGVLDGVAVVPDVEFDRLKVRRCQNIRGMGANPSPLDLPGAHAGEAPCGLHMKP